MKRFLFILMAAAAGCPATAQSGIDTAALREEAGYYVEPVPAFEGPEDKTDAARIDLGRKLFFERRLSRSHQISCNSCHNVSTGGADLQQTSIGHGWQFGPRNAPTMLNARFHKAQFWDGRAADLQEQAGGPPLNPVEMASSEADVVETLRSIPGYKPLFKKAFPDAETPITYEAVTAAIARFEETLTTPDDALDRFMAGDDDALTTRQKRGLRTFLEVGCAGCHSGVALGGESYQKFGMVSAPSDAVRPPDDTGRKAVTGEDYDAYVFKTAALRNVALTPPYFHSGAVWSLPRAVDIMAETQLGVTLSDRQRSDIVAFLEGLTGEQPNVRHPVLPAPDADSVQPDPASDSAERKAAH